MSGDPGVRRILPQNPQMQSFSFAPANFGPRENQKNYVFVDEHNRHKRLKVMRACEGCRRRKIKCDAATTNTWPCSACIRLKLHCIPPTVNYDRDFPAGSQSFEQERGEYETGDEEYQQHLAMQQHLAAQQKHGQQQQQQQQQVYQQGVPYSDGVNMYQPMHQPMAYVDPQQNQQNMPYATMQPMSSGLDAQYPPQTMYPTPPIQHQAPAESPQSYSTDQYEQQDLADLLGELKMNEAGTAPYLSNKKKSVAEEPAFEEVDEYKNLLPPSTSGPDLKIRIPPELMPDEETSMHYFDLFFTHVHPYVPVLNKSAFYHQWHTARETISPLVLEAVFAIAGRLADEPAQGHQWLALAGKHCDAFLDVPRLSTLQALLIVLKARESAPKRGYYYRSWMTVVQCVTMARDLGLDEHYDDHQAGRSCESTLGDCITKTRIWQTLFICELMIGSPQGRTDLSVSIDSLDLSIQRPVPGQDDSEYHVTRNFTYFCRVVKNVRDMNNVYAKIKKKKDWGIDPDLVQLNPRFSAWMSDLPPDLQVSFPDDGTPPWLPSHFIGNLHSYYYLSIIMLHRPQLTFMDPGGLDGQWKAHMMMCYSSAKYLCRLQEAIINTFGLTGLLSMQRGINFTIYCILTCTVLHLVAITSPDPDLNVDARDYFTRHMRILERCTTSWPMPDMQQQIESLRQAFSADVNKPFVLKPSFPYGSPGAPANLSPPRVQYRQPAVQTPKMDPGMGQQQRNHSNPHVSYNSHPITPPISAGGLDSKSDSPGAVQSLVMMAAGQQRAQQPMPNSVPMVDPSAWNPARIFDQWNTTFGTPPSAQSNAPPNQAPLRHPSSSGSGHEAQVSPETIPVGLPSSSQTLAPQQYSTAPVPSFVSPSMWQESVASVYEGGLKRSWEYDGSQMVNQMNKRR